MSADYVGHMLIKLFDLQKFEVLWQSSCLLWHGLFGSVHNI
jgi:hypothetical protein